MMLASDSRIESDELSAGNSVLQSVKFGFPSNTLHLRTFSCWCCCCFLPSHPSTPIPTNLGIKQRNDVVRRHNPALCTGS